MRHRASARRRRDQHRFGWPRLDPIPPGAVRRLRRAGLWQEPRGAGGDARLLRLADAPVRLRGHSSPWTPTKCKRRSNSSKPASGPPRPPANSGSAARRSIARWRRRTSAEAPDERYEAVLVPFALSVAELTNVALPSDRSLTADTHPQIADHVRSHRVTPILSLDRRARSCRRSVVDFRQNRNLESRKFSRAPGTFVLGPTYITKRVIFSEVRQRGALSDSAPIAFGWPQYSSSRMRFSFGKR
jgi:hypothetical protein